MRKLKLQMQITADGFVAGPQGQLDWMIRNMDAPLLAFITELTDSSDTILLGRKMTPGFISYWEGVLDTPESPQFAFAQKMVGIPKVVFSKTAQRVDGKNVRVESGDLAHAVKQLKDQAGERHRGVRRRQFRFFVDTARSDRRAQFLRQSGGDR